HVTISSRRLNTSHSLDMCFRRQRARLGEFTSYVRLQMNSNIASGWGLFDQSLVDHKSAAETLCLKSLCTHLQKPGVSGGKKGSMRFEKRCLEHAAFASYSRSHPSSTREFQKPSFTKTLYTRKN